MVKVTRQHHGGGDHGTGERTPPRLINPDNPQKPLAA